MPRVQAGSGGRASTTSASVGGAKNRVRGATASRAIVTPSGVGTKKFRDVMYVAAPAGQAEQRRFSVPRESRGVYLERRRESAFN